jgi:hypothetical protein
MWNVIKTFGKIGCQDSYWHNKYGEMKANGYILQAPISDRLVMMNSDPTRYTKLLVDAKQMIKDGRSEELMPRQPYLAPITAYRFASLVDYRYASNLSNSVFFFFFFFF